MSAECSAGNIPPGYKQTEVGVIPEDWDHRAFGYLYSEPSRNGIYKTSEFHGRGTRIVNMGEMFGFEFISDQEMTRVDLTDRELATSGLQDGDLLFGRRSVVPAGAGKCSLVLSPVETITFESSIIRVRLDTEKAHSPFYYYFFASPIGRSTVSAIVAGTNVKGIRATELKELKVPVPTKAEQKAIAEALSDMDAFIEFLEQLIAKKRQIKQGAMQELLTGKRRLPGFREGQDYKQTEVGVIPEDWSVVTLRRITSEIGDGIHSTPEYSINGDYFFVNGNNIQNGCIVITKDTKSTNASEHNKYKKNLSSDRTLLLSINGTIGNVAFYSGEPIFLGKSAAYINVNENISRLLVFYLLQTASVTAYFNEGLTGTTIKNLGLNTIRNTPVLIPPTEAEQETIATILSDMDSEIIALEEKLAKARQIKQGMMQELLTGRIRLI